MQINALLEWDAATSRKLRFAVQPGMLRTLAAWLAHSGDSWFWLGALVLLWWFGNQYWKERALALAVGTLITAVLVLAAKFLIRRRRPEGEWGVIYRQTDPHSFPSGHAARAVMLAVMACGLGPTWLAVALLVWAPVVALARVVMGVHYVLDILAGMLFGVVMGLILLIFL